MRNYYYYFLPRTLYSLPLPHILIFTLKPTPFRAKFLLILLFTVTVSVPIYYLHVVGTTCIQYNVQLSFSAQKFVVIM